MEKVLYIETDEEITGVISRIKKERSEKIAIVVPKGAIMIQSVVNLKMLKKHEKDLGKIITIITTDRTGLHLASEVGFQALRSLDKIPDEVLVENNTDRAKLSLRRDEPQKDKDDFDQTVKDIGYSESKTPKPEESNGPTIVFKDSPKSDGSEEEPEITHKKFSDKKDKPQKTPRKKMSKTMKWLLVGFGFIAVVASVLSVFFVLPKATIIVTPIAEELREEVPLRVATGDEDSIEGELIEVSKESSKTVKTTGTKNIGEKAKGSITVYNYWDSNPQPLVSGTRFVADGKTFKTLSAVTVPGTTVSGGDIVPGTVKVNVEASEAGEVYNIGPATFTIPGLPSDKQAKIYGKSSSSMTGGSTRTVKVVSSSDIDSAKTALLDEMLSGVKEDISKNARDKKVLEAAIKTESTKEEFSAKEGQEAEELKVTLAGNYWVFAFSEDDAKNQMEQEIEKTLEENLELVSGRFDSIEYKVVETDKEKGMTLSASVTVYTTEKLELDQAKYDIPGKTDQEVKDYFKTKESVLETKVDFWPFWVKKVPLNRARIYIEVNVGSNE